MKKGFISAVAMLVCGMVVVVLSVVGGGTAAGVQESGQPPVRLPAQDEIAAPPERRAMEQLMRQKLVAAKSLLEGLSRQDHGVVQENAARMIELSRLEAWERMASPRFVQDTVDFVTAAEFLSRVAQSRDSEAQELGFLRLTMTCMNCHRHVRGAAVAGGAGMLNGWNLAGAN